MKITRYFQSCLLIEDNNQRILIDPSAEEAVNVGRFGQLAAVFYTHEHADHFDAALAKNFIGSNVPVYANASTAKLIGAQANVVANGQTIKAGGFEIKVMELPHCLMTDGSAGPQNVGYLINGKLFHPGDGKELAGLQVDVLAVPITGPDISLREAFDFAKQVKAKTLIPIHYDFIGTKPEVFAYFGERFKSLFQIVIATHGQLLEIG